MIKIIIVEDEPAAMRYLRSIIEIKCSGFEIVDTAENGEEGIEKIRLLKPDIVISDIRMGEMDGIELISRVKEEDPFIYSIIVSGYQDFEYAKGAIKGGASDYLLKPVNANQLRDTLDKISEKVYKDYNEKCIMILKEVSSGRIVEPWLIEKYLPYKNFSAAILRKNGLPSRFSSKHGSIYNGISLEINAAIDIKSDNVWVVPGRDDQELVFFYTSEIISENSFQDYIMGLGEKLKSGYHTTVFSSKIFTIEECAKILSEMKRALDNSIVLGVSQKINFSPEVRNTADKRVSLDGTIVNKINFLLSNSMKEELNKELRKLFSIWEKERRAQLWIENSLRQILQLVEKQYANHSNENDYDMEFLLNEALYYSTSFDELMINVWDIVQRIIEGSQKKSHKMNSLEFFKSTQKYVEENLSEQLSLGSVCSMFEISQPYLSKLYRKYEDMSFNEYVTKKRIDKAKQLIEENPKMPLKDIAAFVGYSDPFYFSRVFRAETGIPPSEYLESK
jgi:two-component system response regulator YesN